jgi:hypothetical protein
MRKNGHRLQRQRFAKDVFGKTPQSPQPRWMHGHVPGPLMLHTSHHTLHLALIRRGPSEQCPQFLAWIKLEGTAVPPTLQIEAPTSRQGHALTRLEGLIERLDPYILPAACARHDVCLWAYWLPSQRIE